MQARTVAQSQTCNTCCLKVPCSSKMGAPACSCGPEKSVVVRILEKLRLYAWIHKMQTAKCVPEEGWMLADF
eukprot:1159810-Pelagomonas_calceolata.AAC.12